MQHPLVMNADLWVADMSMITGAICYASFFGWVALLIGKLDRSGARRNELKDFVTDHIAVLNLPTQLAKRIHNYYDFLWERTRCLDRKSFFSELSLPLAKEIALHTYFAIVLEVPMFQNVEGNFLVYLIPRLETVIYLPGDYGDTTILPPFLSPSED